MLHLKFLINLFILLGFLSLPIELFQMLRLKQSTLITFLALFMMKIVLRTKWMMNPRHCSHLDMAMEQVLATHLHINFLAARPCAGLKDHRSSIWSQVKYTSSYLSTILSHQLTCILMAFILMEIGTVMISFVKCAPECFWNIYGTLTRPVLAALVYHCVSDEVANLT